MLMICASCLAQLTTNVLASGAHSWSVNIFCYGNCWCLSMLHCVPDHSNTFNEKSLTVTSPYKNPTEAAMRYLVSITFWFLYKKLSCGLCINNPPDKQSWICTNYSNGLSFFVCVTQWGGGLVVSSHSRCWSFVWIIWWEFSRAAQSYSWDTGAEKLGGCMAVRRSLDPFRIKSHPGIIKERNSRESDLCRSKRADSG